MSKRRHNWVGESSDVYKVSTQTKSKHAFEEAELHDVELDEGDKEFLDEAHEALSKLYTKASKRERQMRGVRRKDAWQ